MNNNSDVKSIHKLLKQGQDALKTSFFSLKFKPDHLSAVSYFTDAAIGYKKAKLFKDSLIAFEEAIKCNKILLESWAEAQNWQEMADICIFELNDFNTGWKYLKNSSLSYKYSGKFSSGIKVYMDFAHKLIENRNQHSQALVILKEAVDDCFDQTHDELVRISLEESLNKIIDVYCQLEKYVDAILLLEKYIKFQLSRNQKGTVEEPKHKITKNYLKLAMLRIIIKELYMAENLVDEMFSVYDSSTSDDIDDLRKLIRAFKDFNKKDFNFLVTYAFSLFQNNLLKALKKAFDERLLEQTTSNNIFNSNQIIANNSNQIIGNNFNNNYETDSIMGFDKETKADSEIGEVEVNNNINNNAQYYL